MTFLSEGTVQEQLQQIEFIKKTRELAAKIKDIKIAMLTTTTEDGRQHSGPMYTFELKDDGIIWLFIAKGSEKLKQIQANPDVLLTYSDPQNDLYVAVNGRAEVSDNKIKIEELWSDRYKLWFPHGKDDPNLCVLKIEPLKAEYWDSPDLLIAQLITLAKNTFKGNPYVETDNKKIDF